MSVVLPFHFYNWDREWRSLTEAVKSSQAELFVVYGRRGIGKSALLRAVLDA